MRIGIDVDDTLTNTSESFDKVIKKYNVDFSKNFKEFWTEEEKNFIFKNYLKETLYNAELKENVNEIINKLLNEGHELIIITARNNKHCEKIEEQTKQYLKEKNIEINQMYFGQNIKSDLGKKLNLDLMIDDNINVFNNMKNEHIDCILFGDKIKTWKEVFEYIKRKG